VDRLVPPGGNATFHRERLGGGHAEQQGGFPGGEIPSPWIERRFLAFYRLPKRIEEGHLPASIQRQGRSNFGQRRFASEVRELRVFFFHPIHQLRFFPGVDKIFPIWMENFQGRSTILHKRNFSAPV
jgi:hypothetical protein